MKYVRRGHPDGYVVNDGICIGFRWGPERSRGGAQGCRAMWENEVSHVRNIPSSPLINRGYRPITLGTRHPKRVGKGGQGRPRKRVLLRHHWDYCSSFQ